MLNILHLTPIYYPARGGSQAHIGHLSEYLVRQGHQVTILTTNVTNAQGLRIPAQEPSQLSHEEWIGGVRVLRFPMRYWSPAQYSVRILHRLLWLCQQVSFVPLWLLYRFGRILPNAPSLYEWLNKTQESFDIVGATHLPFDGLIAAGQAFAKRRNIPFIIYPFTHFGVGETPGSDPESRFYTMRHQISLAIQSDALWAETQFEANYYQNHGMDAHKITVGGSGIDPDDLHGGDADRFFRQYPMQTPFVLYLGALARSKGIIQTIDAVRLLWKQGAEVELVVAGAMTDEFKIYWKGLPESDQARVNMLGYVSNEMRRDLLAACAVFCMPSKMDSFGIAYVEAWYYQKPVIAADSWGVRELVRDGETGLLVPHGDVSTTAATIQRLLSDPVLSSKLGLAGHRLAVDEHTWVNKCYIADDLYSCLTVAR